MITEKELKNNIKKEIDFYIYNHDKKRFLSIPEITKYIYSYGSYYQKEIKLKLEGYAMVELFKEMFDLIYIDYDTYSFCELELIEKPLIIFGITEDLKQIKRIRELKKEMRINNILKRKEEIK